MTVPLEHSRLGPSTWARWLRCVGAPNAEAGLPDTAGVEAAQGTVFHEMVSDCLTYGLLPEHFLGSKMIENGFEIEVDREMVDSAEEGMAYVEQMAAQPGVQLFVEKRVSIEPWCGPGEFGTTDVGLVNVSERWIKILDWKYGMEPVYAVENDQGRGYCLGFWHTIAAKLFGGDPSDIEVEIIIEQPRVPGAGGAWKTTMSRVLEWGEWVKRQAMKTQDPDAPRTPGEKQCRWCKARKTCGAYAQFMLDVMALTFDEIDEGADFDLPPILPKNVTPERRSYILKHKSLIDRWLDDLHASAYHDAVHGLPTPGLKLVDGRRPARKWSEDKLHKAKSALLQHLDEDKVFPRSMISPAQAEKEIGKSKFARKLDRFVDEGEAKPVLADERDTREARPTIADAFDDLP